MPCLMLSELNSSSTSAGSPHQVGDGMRASRPDCSRLGDCCLLASPTIGFDEVMIAGVICSECRCPSNVITRWCRAACLV